MISTSFGISCKSVRPYASFVDDNIKNWRLRSDTSAPSFEPSINTPPRNSISELKSLFSIGSPAKYARLQPAAHACMVVSLFHEITSRQAVGDFKAEFFCSFSDSSLPTITSPRGSSPLASMSLIRTIRVRERSLGADNGRTHGAFPGCPGRGVDKADELVSSQPHQS